MPTTEHVGTFTNKDSSGNVQLLYPRTKVAAVDGAVSTERKINGKALSADISISAADVGAVPIGRKVNNKALSADITLAASDVGAVPTTRKVNNKALSADISLTAADVGAATPSAVQEAYDLANGKQDKLTFDSTPTKGSSNPVTSDGVYRALGQIKVNVLLPDIDVKPILNDNSWAVISQVSQADLAANVWSVGDCKAVTIKGTVGTQSINGTYCVYILGFNHNEAKEGKGIHFGGFKTALSGGTDICLVDSYHSRYKSYDGTKYFQMNHRNYDQNGCNYGGWAACDMRYDILGSTNKAPSGYGSDKTASAIGYNPTTTCATSPIANTLMAALPADLRKVMKPMTKYTNNKGNKSNVAKDVTATTDYLPLLAEFEIFGRRTHANVYEKDYQTQYAYYSSGNSKEKYCHNDIGAVESWWERSPYVNDERNFCNVYDLGNSSESMACYSLGLAPIFKV